MIIWKDIKNYEGYYQVSNDGRVKSLKYAKSNNKRELVQSLRNGYKCVTLAKNGKKENINVHRLIAETFIPNQDNKPEVDHINTIKTDNRVENLRWVDRTGNNNNELTKRKRSVTLTNRKDQSKKIYQIDLETGEIVKTWESTKDCEKNGYPARQYIRECCNGKRKTYKGYKWSYVPL